MSALRSGPFRHRPPRLVAANDNEIGAIIAARRTRQRLGRWLAIATAVQLLVIIGMFALLNHAMSA